MKLEPSIVAWLPAMHRLIAGEKLVHQVRCAVCQNCPIRGLRFELILRWSIFITRINFNLYLKLYCLNLLYSNYTIILHTNNLVFMSVLLAIKLTGVLTGICLTFFPVLSVLKVIHLSLWFLHWLWFVFISMLLMQGPGF